MTLPLLRPSLYAVDVVGQLVLLGGRCACGYTFFPMQTYGCERCGKTGAALTPTTLTARGRLIAAATVHIHADPRRVAPFVVGAITLDDGPVVRMLLDEEAAASIPPGRRVHAVLVAVTVDGHEVLDLRFKVEAAGAMS